MIILLYDCLFGFQGLYLYNGDCIHLFKGNNMPVHTSIGFAWLRRLRVRHFEYWHPG